MENKKIKKITYKNKEDNNGNVISEQKINLNCDDLENAEKLFHYLGFNRLVEVKYHVIVYEKNGMELAFQIVENLGTLIEYEHKDDFSDKTISEINEVKRKMVNDIKEYKLNISDEKDIKKAFELIKKNIIYKNHKNKVE